MANIIKLTDDEVLELEGVLENNREVNDLICYIKEKKVFQARNLTEPQARFITDVLRVVRKSGKLTLVYKNINYCSYSEKVGGYAEYTRNTSYYRKGELNYNKPLMIRGIGLQYDCTSIQGKASLECSVEFFNKVKEILREVLKDIKADLPEELTGKSREWIKMDIIKCVECEWEGPRSDLGMLPAIIDGYYPGQCPKCLIKNQFLTTYVEEKKPKEWRLIPVQDITDNIKRNYYRLPPLQK